MPASPSAARNDAVVNLSKRRGFVFPSSEIYGGTRSAWDYGPLGVELKENVRRQWWQAMVTGRDDIVGLDSAVILAAAGVGGVRPRRHVQRPAHRVPALPPSLPRRPTRGGVRGAQGPASRRRPGRGSEPCPNCGTRGQWTEPRPFNGMLSTYLGPVEDESALHYLRPETAQGIFINFLNVMTTARKKPPFGIAQTGKSFRNEITPGNFIFRTREFEQMEMEFFVEPGTDEKWHEYWLEQRWNWYVDLGIDAGEPALLRAPEGEAVALLDAHRRHRVPLRLRRLRVRRARGHRQPHRLRPADALEALGRRPDVLRPGEERALDAVRDRAGGRA